MYSTDEMNKQKRVLWGLLIQCPFVKGAERHCPLTHFRDTMDLEEKFDFADEMPSSTVTWLLEQHLHCYQKREADWLATIPVAG